MACRSGQESLIIGSLPRSDALRYRCHSILSLQRVMAQLHDQAAVHMPAEAHLQLLTVLQVCSQMSTTGSGPVMSPTVTLPTGLGVLASLERLSQLAAATHICCSYVSLTVRCHKTASNVQSGLASPTSGHSDTSGF